MPPSPPADPAAAVTDEPAAPATVVLDEQVLRDWSMPIHEGGDKHARGTVLVIGGSPTTPGAVRLAGEAALRMGAGRLQIATADTVTVALAIAVPESLVLPLRVDGAGAFHWQLHDRLDPLVRSADAVLIGPGMVGMEATVELLERCASRLGPETLLVLDAIALPAWREVPAVRRAPLAGRIIVTPNRQELRSLLGDEAPGDDVHDVDDGELAHLAARSLGVVVSCFGRITAPDGRTFDVGTGSPGLGTSGSGDVLAGLVVGAAARCGDPAQAACWGTYAHTTAGGRLADRSGQLGFLARDLVSEVPAVLDALTLR